MRYQVYLRRLAVQSGAQAATGVTDAAVALAAAVLVATVASVTVAVLLLLLAVAS